MHAAYRYLLLLLAALCCAPAARAETATVAVAANFVATLEAIEARFMAETGHELVIVTGSTGQLYAQAVNGAPFDVFLSGDALRPQLLAEAGVGETGTRFTYAIGRLVLWSREPERFGDLELAALGTERFAWLAIANPRLAPYGAAAREALQRLGLWESLQPRIVQGQNIAQAFAMTATRNAELGLVALSQALAYDGPAVYVEVPQTLHEPIRQDAILLRGGRGNAAAAELLAFLRSSGGRQIIEAHGYRTVGGSVTRTGP